MTGITFGIQDMVDRMAAGFARQAWSGSAELVVDVPPPLSGGGRPWRGNLDQLVDRLDALGHAAMAEMSGNGTVVLTIHEVPGGAPPQLGLPHSQLLRFHVQAADAAHGRPASSPYFFEQLLAPAEAVVPPPVPLPLHKPLSLQRILAVDDNLDAMRVLLQLGQAVGLHILPTHDAADATRAVSRALDSAADFDLVLLDAQLPLVDARGCARRLREAGCRAPVLLMAGPGDHAALALLAPHEPLGRELGVAGVLRKPLVDGQVLAQACLAALQHRSLPVSPMPPPSNVPQRLPTMTTSAVPASPGLPALPGVDTAIGRASTMNNERLYRRLLIKFRDAQAQAPVQVADALAQGDPVLARRLAHDLASVSGTLGAMALHDTARRLEAICAGEADAADLPQTLAQTRAALAVVIDGLQQLGTE